MDHLWLGTHMKAANELFVDGNHGFVTRGHALPCEFLRHIQVHVTLSRTEHVGLAMSSNRNPPSHPWNTLRHFQDQ